MNRCQLFAACAGLLGMAAVPAVPKRPVSGQLMRFTGELSLPIKVAVPPAVECERIIRRLLAEYEKPPGEEFDPTVAIRALREMHKGKA